MKRARLLVLVGALFSLPDTSHGLLIDDFSTPLSQVQPGAGFRAGRAPGALTGSRYLESNGPTISAGANQGGVLRIMGDGPDVSRTVIAWDALVAARLGLPITVLDLTAFGPQARIALDVVGVEGGIPPGGWIQTRMAMVWYDFAGNGSGTSVLNVISSVPQTFSWGIFGFGSINLDQISRIEFQIDGTGFELDNFRIIPEPSIAVLLAVGLTALSARRR